jgi:xanthine dehydrogenase accessory factor
MITAGLSRRAEELAAQGRAFVTRDGRARAAPDERAGRQRRARARRRHDRGLRRRRLREHSVRVYSLKAIESGEPVLLRILPDADGAGLGIDAEADGRRADRRHGSQELPSEEGLRDGAEPCLSGGAIEVFLEPVLPAPRVLVVGDTPIAGRRPPDRRRARARDRRPWTARGPEPTPATSR